MRSRSSTGDFQAPPYSNQFTRDQQRKIHKSTFPETSLDFKSYDSITLPDSINTTRNPEHIRRKEVDVDNLHHLDESLRKLFNECNQNPLVCSLMAQQQNVLSVYMKYCTFDYLVDAKKNRRREC